MKRSKTSKNIVQPKKNLISTKELELLSNALPKLEPSENLTVFIRMVDELIKQLDGHLNDNLIHALNMSIRSKIEGDARDYIDYQNAMDWPAIRKCLILEYTDPRSEFTLLTDLLQCAQKKNETFLEYHTRLCKIYSALVQHFNLNIIDDDSFLQFKISEHRKWAVNTFVNKVSEPYRSYLKDHVAGLKTLEGCLEKCQELETKPSILSGNRK